MLASRDQENLVHAYQTAAAGKPLQPSVRGLHPKTPGNRAPRTPFRVALNDENRPLALNGQKPGFNGVGKGTENALQGIKKDGKPDKSAFITPIGPRPRAPLGAKTTNAKGQALQTPGFGPQTVKQGQTKRPSTTRKLIKSKIAVAPSEPVEADLLALEDDDVPDVEYAPPPPVELADPPEVFEYDETFPQFRGANMCRGWEEIYLAEPTDEHGVPLSFREYEEKCARYDREVERQIQESVKDIPDLDAELDQQVDAMIAAGPRSKAPQVARVDTMRARGAANALSHSKAPLVAMKPTASSIQKSRKPAFSVLSSRDAPAPSNPSSMRHTAAAAVSKTTIGFPRARPAPSIIPPKPQQPRKDTKPTQKHPVNQRDMHPARFRDLYGDPPEGSDMWVRLRQHDRLTGEAGEFDSGGELFNTDSLPPEVDDEEVFQLALPS